jgi:hypothetical protein
MGQTQEKEASDVTDVGVEEAKVCVSVPARSSLRDLRNCIILRNPSTNALVYVVGTAHVGDSKDDVVRVMRHAKPDVVVVELCPSRSGMLYTNDEEVSSLELDAAAIDPSQDEAGLDLIDTAKDAADVLLDWSNIISLMYAVVFYFAWNFYPHV